MLLNERLQQFRERAGYENAKLFAKAIGMPYSTYSTYESGKSEPKATALIRIAAALHVSLDDLLDYHVDDFNKAATLFHEATGGTATLKETGVELRPPTGGIVIYPQPISKAAFLKAIKDATTDFDESIRPRLLRDAILNQVNQAYSREHLQERIKMDLPFSLTKGFDYSAHHFQAKTKSTVALNHDSNKNNKKGPHSKE